MAEVCAAGSGLYWVYYTKASGFTSPQNVCLTPTAAADTTYSWAAFPGAIDHIVPVKNDTSSLATISNTSTEDSGGVALTATVTPTQQATAALYGPLGAQFSLVEWVLIGLGVFLVLALVGVLVR